jgi:hypothetical protein
LNRQRAQCSGYVCVAHDVVQKRVHQVLSKLLESFIFLLIWYGHDGLLFFMTRRGAAWGRQRQRQRPVYPKLIQIPKDVSVKHRFSRVRLHGDR